MMTRHNVTDILAIQDAAENSNYWQFIDWLEMNDCEIFNAEGKPLISTTNQWLAQLQKELT